MVCSEFLCRAIQFGILDATDYPPEPGDSIELEEIQQPEGDRSSDLADLQGGIRLGVYREVTECHADRARWQGAVASYAFTV